MEFMFSINLSDKLAILPNIIILIIMFVKVITLHFGLKGFSKLQLWVKLTIAQIKALVATPIIIETANIFVIAVLFLAVAEVLIF